MRKSFTIILNEKKVEVNRVALRAWFQLEDIRQELRDATDRKDREGIIANIYSYLSVAISNDYKFDTLPWFDVINAYRDMLVLNSPSIEFPMFKPLSVEKRKANWDYPERTWYAWVHVLASVYGWSLEYISELDIDDAIALVEEIAIDEQLKKEWEWALSEKSVQYDKRGKGTFKELKRPVWMMGTVTQELKKMRVKKSMLPMGLIVKWNNDETIDA